MTFDLLAILLAFSAVTFAPGPANLAVGLVAMARGWRGALPMAAGLATGLAFWGVLAASGLGALMAASEVALTVLRIGGGAYLMWLAWRSARAACGPAEPLAAPASGAFRRGFLLNLSNPKAVFAWLAALSMGLGPQAGPSALALATGLCALIGLANYLTWAFVLSRGGARAAYSRARVWVEGAAAALFALAGASLLRQGVLR